MKSKPRSARGLSLWALVESLQQRFEAKGLGPDAVDAAVIGRVGTLMTKPGQNDQRSPKYGSLLLFPAPTEA